MIVESCDLELHHESQIKNFALEFFEIGICGGVSQDAVTKYVDLLSRFAAISKSDMRKQLQQQNPNLDHHSLDTAINRNLLSKFNLDQ